MCPSTGAKHELRNLPPEVIRPYAGARDRALCATLWACLGEADGRDMPSRVPRMLSPTCPRLSEVLACNPPFAQRRQHMGSMGGHLGAPGRQAAGPRARLRRRTHFLRHVSSSATARGAKPKGMIAIGRMSKHAATRLHFFHFGAEVKVANLDLNPKPFSSVFITFSLNSTLRASLDSWQRLTLRELAASVPCGRTIGVEEGDEIKVLAAEMLSSFCSVN